MGKLPDFYVDPKQRGIVRGGWFDEMGGMFVGVHAAECCKMLNGYNQLQAQVDRIINVTQYGIALKDGKVVILHDLTGGWVKMPEIISLIKGEGDDQKKL